MLYERCTHCRHKYRAKTKRALCFYCDPVQREAAARREREEELAEQVDRDLAEGRRDGWTGRIKPTFEE